MGNDNITDPFIGLGVMPATSALFRDMTGIRFQHPQWDPENCTACGDCYTICPDTAIPGLVNGVDQIFDTVVKRVRKSGKDVEHLPKRDAPDGAASCASGWPRRRRPTAVRGMLDDAIEETLKNGVAAGDKERLAEELGWFREELGDFRFALSRPYFTIPEKQQSGGGGLLSITVNPYTCKGCMECVEVCGDDALQDPVQQTEESVEEAALRLGFLARPAHHAPRSTSASTTSRKASGRWRRSCSTSRITSPSAAATAPASAVPRRPSSTSSWPPSRR